MKKKVLVGLLCYLYLQNVHAQVPVTVSDLRSKSFYSTDSIYLITDPGRQGLFYYDINDHKTRDNNGTVFTSGNKRFKRIYSGPIDARWFGMKADWNWKDGTDNTNALMAAINAADNNEKVIVPDGRYYIKGIIRLPLTTQKKVILEIFGDIYFEIGGGFFIEGPNQLFKSYGLIAGKNSGATTEATYETYRGTGLYLKNLTNSEIEMNEVKDFKYGIELVAESSGNSEPVCKNNRVSFNNIHHNHTQIRISMSAVGNSSNVKNEGTSWYGGQLGRGRAFYYGKGGWYGVKFVKEQGCTSKDVISAHNFYDIGFEGLEIGISMADAASNNFIGGRFEHPDLREGFDLDPKTAVGTSFIGEFAMVERYFKPGRMGVNTMVEGTPMWSGTTNEVIWGIKAFNSISPNRMLAITNKYGYTNFNVNKANDVISMTGQYPSVEAMKYRIDSVIRAVPYKKTYFEVKKGTKGKVLNLPPNIGMVRIDAGEEKILRIDSGDLVTYGDYFLVDYQSPAYPVTFVRNGRDSVTLISSKSFTSGGTYQCLWVDERFKISKLGSEYRTEVLNEASGTVSEGVKMVYVNYALGDAVLNLPSASRYPGRKIQVKNLQKNHTVTVKGIAAEDENRIPPAGSFTLQSDGKTWNVTGAYIKEK